MRTFIAVSAVVLLAGCGSSSNKSSSSGSSYSAPASTQSSAPSAASSGGATAVQIKGFAFNPASTTVKVGQKVTWTNHDSVAHNVQGGPLKSATLQQGDSYSYTPKKAGTISYVCTFHAQMKATLVVTS